MSDFTRVDLVSDLEDILFLFLDGKYVGHDDQIELTDICPAGSGRKLVWFSHELDPSSVNLDEDWWEDVYDAAGYGFEAIRKYLKPITEVV